MTSREVRRVFLEFFAAREHKVVPSSPLVLPADPTLLFANAGMNQFKEVFTGRERREYVRAATSQKCLRVSGKHNDLETVGRTPRHHTFFEMLGNFSFGDYFKERAIALAWELVTEVYRLPVDRLWATVFGGSGPLAADEEAHRLWRDRIGLPAERILRLGERENFWRMGDTGPCGPCSELHFDLGADLTSVDGPSTPATDERRYIEIWNLVFMEFEQHADGSLTALPRPSIDTGMGLERITAVVQGRRSNYETDLFAPLIAAAARRVGTRYGEDEAADFSLRVIADHVRALCFLVADGVVPANDKRGYVLRRLLRRAIRHGRRLGLNEPFLHELTPVVIDDLGAVYPELVSARAAILEVGRREEQRFAETLAAGLGLYEEALGKLDTPDGGRPVLPGAELFRLYDTYGFPLDLARDIAEERGVVLDEAGFEAEMERQRTRARASWKGGKASATGQGEGRIETSFLRDSLEAQAKIVSELTLTAEPSASRDEIYVFLDRTPFYAEAGGQVGDTGLLVGTNFRAQILNTYRDESGNTRHQVKIESGQLPIGEVVQASVDAARRAAIQRNHTATHLVHAALREVLGTHVKQAGSLVAPDRLRFDFAHFTGISDEALADIESLVNRKVLEDLPIETSTMPLEDALASGAMALFGEKYGGQVRVVRIDEFSLELCGGTHCERTGQIGLIKVIAERGVASGVRRVEALSGEGSLQRFREEHAVLRALEEKLSVSPEKLREEVERRLEQLRAVERELEQTRLAGARTRLLARAEAPLKVAGVSVLAERVEGLGSQELRALADQLRRQLGSGVVVLGRAESGKVSLLVAVTDDLRAQLSAGDLVRELAPLIGGGGGGRPDLAEAGGKNPEGLEPALAAAVDAIRRRLGG